MNKSLIVIISTLFLVTFLISCDKEKDNDCNTANMSYTMNVVPLLEKNGCMTSGCHGGNAADNPLFMGSYESLKAVVDIQRLIGSIKHEQGFSPMPKGGSKISDCDIRKIEAWVTQGAKNN